MQRQSNNFRPKFTDEECITIYLWGIQTKIFEMKAIYEFTKTYLDSWFPDLPSYQAFNKRISFLSEDFKIIADILIKQKGIVPEISDFVIDSMPIILASEKRSHTAKICKEICNRGYCASKNMYYYGLKLHVLMQNKYKKVGNISEIMLSQASENDLKIGKLLLSDIYNIKVYGDKMYIDKNWSNELLKKIM